MKSVEKTTENLSDMLREKDAEIAELKQQVNWLMEQLKLSKHRQFGTSSEKSEYDQRHPLQSHRVRQRKQRYSV